MDRLIDVELLLAQARDVLKEASKDINDDEAMLLLEITMLLHDISVFRERDIIRQGKFAIKKPLEIH